MKYKLFLVSDKGEVIVKDINEKYYQVDKNTFTVNPISHNKYVKTAYSGSGTIYPAQCTQFKTIKEILKVV